VFGRGGATCAIYCNSCQRARAILANPPLARSTRSGVTCPPHTRRRRRCSNPYPRKPGLGTTTRSPQTGSRILRRAADPRLKKNSNPDLIRSPFAAKDRADGNAKDGYRRTKSIGHGAPHAAGGLVDVWLPHSGVNEGKVFRRVLKNGARQDAGVTANLVWYAVNVVPSVPA